MNAVGTVRGGRVLGHHLLGDPSLVLHGPERIVRGRRWGLWVDRPPVSGDTWCPPMPVRFSNGWRSPARYGLSLVKARPANDGRGAAASATGLSGTAQGAERRVFDRRLGIVGQCQLDKAVKILQHFGIPLDRGLPVLVDSTLQLSLSRSDLVRMRRRMVVMIRMCCDTLQVVAMRCFPSLGKESEILQDVVLRMCSHPCSVGRGGAKVSKGAVVPQCHAGGEEGGNTYRMSLYIDCIIRDSAWRTAMSRPLASQSHESVAGAWHMAQSGSILMTDLRGLGW